MRALKTGARLVDTNLTPMLFLMPDNEHYVLHIKSGEGWAAAPCTIHPMAREYSGTPDAADIRWLFAIQASLVDLLDRETEFRELCCVGMSVPTTRRFIRGADAWPEPVRKWVRVLHDHRWGDLTISGRELRKDERRMVMLYWKKQMGEDIIRDCMATSAPSTLYTSGLVFDAHE